MIHFQISKSTLDSLKSVFNVFRRKPSLGAPENKTQRIGTFLKKNSRGFRVHSQIKKIKVYQDRRTHALRKDKWIGVTHWLHCSWPSLPWERWLKLAVTRGEYENLKRRATPRLKGCKIVRLLNMISGLKMSEYLKQIPWSQTPSQTLNRVGGWTYLLHTTR